MRGDTAIRRGILPFLALGACAFATVQLPRSAGDMVAVERNPILPSLLHAPSAAAATLGVAAQADGPAIHPSTRRAHASADDSAAANSLAPPRNLVTRSGDRSAVLHWDRGAAPGLLGYNLYRALSTNGPLALLATTPSSATHYVDFNVTNGMGYAYAVSVVTSAGESPDSEPATAAPGPFTDNDSFLDYLEHTAVDYFWYEANPTNGLIRDRSAPTSPCSIAAVGFGLTAICIGIDHGWIPRDAGRDRTLATLSTFWDQPQSTNRSGIIGYRGWFYHFLDMNTAVRSGTSELSSIDTALFLAGVLYAKQYFNGTDTNEVSIRSLADALFSRVDWNWMANGGPTVDMGWTPETGFLASRWIGYDEGMILYLLGMGAATNPLPAASWAAWTKGYRWQTNYGYTYIVFPPLFGHQYSHCWVDFRHVADAYMLGKGITYFENSRRATLAQRAYAIAKSGFSSYSSNVWGFTACDGPGTGSYLGYAARGAPPAQNDDGTIAPTAPGGSLPFAPEFCLPTLRNLYDRYLTNLWCAYGFRDAFNLSAHWWDPDVLGIDQGPIAIMAENYRSQNVWRRFMQNPEVQRGLQAAGFTNLAFVSPTLQPAADLASFNLTWGALNGRSYQVEFSPDLSRWFFSSTGFLTATGLVSSLGWEDNGPPATDTSPAGASQRFYRVFQMGGP